MKIKLLRKPLRRNWSRHPNAHDILLERDLSVCRSRIKAKLLVFRTRLALRQFWKHALGIGDLGRGCLGAVNSLSCHVLTYDRQKNERQHIEADPRYFCVIGLVKGQLSMEIICHEAVHAAFAYAKRARRTAWDHHIRHFDEESICYPAGIIAGAINRAIFKAGLHE